MDIDEPVDVKLEYEIAQYSSFSLSYRPENILVEREGDQGSRWSSDSNHQPQFLLLRLKKLAVVKRIRFGKFEKTHVCNLKRFRILGGLSEDGLVELLEDGLKNDSTPEIFPLKHKVNGAPFPSLFIKIVPLQSWGPSFNFSIWHVELVGDNRPSYVQQCSNGFDQYREKEAMRLCLKFLRDRNYLDICEQLQTASGAELEAPVVSQLFRTLVTEGKFREAEKIIHQHQDLVDEYAQSQPYEPIWTPIHTESGWECPGMRGGHQMALDPVSQTIYLLGGWDGNRDLADMWAFSMTEQKWTCLSEDTEKDGGPSSRSCHKMILDPGTQQLFVLGKYVEASNRSEEALRSDFYSYHIPSGTWHLLASNTTAYGGPRLLFDHQMALDPLRGLIYCFGGRVLIHSDPTVAERRLTEPQFSPLYVYHIATNTWKQLREDSDELSPSATHIRSRVGHAMVFDPVSRVLFMMAGIRGKEHLADILAYDVDRDHLSFYQSSAGIPLTVPAAGFTQRATMDSDLGEIYVLSGMNKDRREEGVKNCFWIFNRDSQEWSCVYENDMPDNSSVLSRDNAPTREQWDEILMLRRNIHIQQQEPCPRYAHQLVYDPLHKRHYLFGGNPGKSPQLKLRLDDFWMLKLHKPVRSEILASCVWKLRTGEFRELAATSPLKALQFLQTDISALVHSDNPKENQQLHDLASELMMVDGGAEGKNETYFRTKRNELFHFLIAYFPQRLVPPRKNLLDLIVHLL